MIPNILAEAVGVRRTKLKNHETAVGIGSGRQAKQPPFSTGGTANLRHSLSQIKIETKGP
jgi:hypothetical protein